MLFLYNILTHFVGFILKIFALFNQKIKLGVLGRASTFNKLSNTLEPNHKSLWFHCASLGEYEQGLPVFEEIKQMYPEHQVVLSFFSPSGYEVRKNSKIADVVIYLPLDTRKNAKRFLHMVNPELVVFVKYEIWPNYLYQMQKIGIKSILISALFNSQQIYFKSYGRFMLNALKTFDHIFVQDKFSLELLSTYSINNVTLSGDTRFDRVHKQLSANNNLDFIDDFKQDALCVVAGSTWPEDEKLLIEFINQDSSNTKYIIAPHNINQKQIMAFTNKLSKPNILYSNKTNHNLNEYSVLVIDTIGLLSKIYNYSDIAYVGGAVGKTGLHNTLEPAVFGVPIIIGKHYLKFPEAIQMIENKGMFSISSQSEFNNILEKLIDNELFRKKSGCSNSEYIKKNQGAVVQILDYLRI